MKPISADERISALDALRGAAVLGILLVNIRHFAFPITAEIFLLRPAPDNAGEIAARAFMNFFGEYKFVTLFSLLFGTGIALQTRRWQRKKLSPTGYHARRLLALAFLGTLHGLVLWPGDILLTYAILGAVAALFVLKTTASTRLIWGVIMIVLGWFLNAVSLGFTDLNYPSAITRLPGLELQIHSAGSAADLLRWRAFAYPGLTGLLLLIFGLRLAGLFLIGSWAADSHWLVEYLGRPDSLSKITRRGLAVGIPLEIVYIYLDAQGDFSNTTLPALWSAHYFGSLGLSIAYLSALFACYGRGKRFAWLETVGRMPLTNYIAQSAVAGLIFYPYGLGWFGSVPITVCLAIWAGLSAAQILWSRWWLSKHSQGPLEGLLRRMTYRGSAA